MKIDVIMCTFNSNKPYFLSVLYSIKENLDVNKFIVVDKFSKDGTIEIVKSIFDNVEIIQTNEPLSMARKLGIEKVETEYFMFIDDDVLITREYVETLFKVIERDDKIGAVHGYVFPRDLIQLMSKIYQNYPDEIVITREIMNCLRGCTYATLIKTSIVKDWNPIPINRLEDHLLLRHVVSKGYKWVILPKLHLLALGENKWKFLKKILIDSKYMKKIGLKKCKLGIKHSIMKFTLKELIYVSLVKLVENIGRAI